MAELLVPDLENEVVERLERRAGRNGVPREEELRRILREAAGAAREELLTELAALRALTPSEPRRSAEELLRDIRDSH